VARTGCHRSKNTSKLICIVLLDKRENARLLIDIAKPDDSKFNTKETKKKSRNKYLVIDDSRMWRVRTKIEPVVIGAVGTTKIRTFSCSQFTCCPQTYRRAH
jgi:hypothetical protein